MTKLTLHVNNSGEISRDWSKWKQELAPFVTFINLFGWYGDSASDNELCEL